MSSKFFSDIIAFIASNSFLRSLAKWAVKTFKPKKNVSIYVHGHIMQANTLDRIAALILWKFSAREGPETLALKKAVKEAMVVLDIGANIGYYTVQFAKWVGPQGKVYAFEPDPENFKLLVENARLNGCANVLAIQKAVSDKTGTAQLFFCEEHRGDHRIFKSKESRETLPIETVALDDFFQKEERVDVIKMDIQGAEYLALLGMEELIRKNNPTLIIELSPPLLLQCGFKPEQFIDRIASLRLLIRWIHPKTNQLEFLDREDLLKLCAKGRDIHLFLTKQ